MEEKNRLYEQGGKASKGAAEPARAKEPVEIYLRACRGPLADGSCRMPEETCNNPICPARG